MSSSSWLDRLTYAEERTRILRFIMLLFALGIEVRGGLLSTTVSGVSMSQKCTYLPF